MTTSGISPEPNGEVGAFLVLLFRDTFVAADDAREGGEGCEEHPPSRARVYFVKSVCVCACEVGGGSTFRSNCTW